MADRVLIVPAITAVTDGTAVKGLAPVSAVTTLTGGTAVTAMTAVTAVAALTQTWNLSQAPQACLCKIILVWVKCLA